MIMNVGIYSQEEVESVMAVIMIECTCIYRFINPLTVDDSNDPRYYVQ